MRGGLMYKGIVDSLITISLLIFSVLLLSPNLIFSAKTNLEDENFSGMHLNQNINEINEVPVLENKENPNIYYLSNGLRLISDKQGSIKALAITHKTDKTVKTSRGISIGDTLETVKKTYGSVYENREEQGVGIIVYKDNNHFLEFWHWDDKVTEIRYGTKSN
jgi:uncharacterized protein YpmB